MRCRSRFLSRVTAKYYDGAYAAMQDLVDAAFLP